MPIPVTLHHKGKSYDGQLSAPNGGGTSTWHLAINNFHRGELTFSDKNGWVFHTQEGRHDEWALVLGKFVVEALPEIDFKPELPPPFKMFSFTHEGREIDVHSLHGGSYYLAIKGKDQAYFMRRDTGNGPFWHYTHYPYKEIFIAAGARVDEYEKDWKGNPQYNLVKDSFTKAIGYVPV